MENHQVLADQPIQPIPPQPAAWERKPNESAMWFDRFNTYRTLGPARSIRSTYLAHLRETPDYNELQEKTTTTAPSAWYRRADEYNWKARADAFDRCEHDKTWADEEQVRERFRRLRREGLTLLLEKATQGLRLKGAETLEKETIAALSQAMKTSIRESREESEGYSSKTKLEVDIILKQLPPELQKLIQSAIKPSK